MADPTGRFLIAFDDDTLDPTPTWTRIDSYPNLVTSYTIDRGRQYELDRTDVGRATVQIIDPDGILDPTNPGGPFWNTTLHATKIRPLLQATLGRYNPVTATWSTRYRGFIEEMDYDFDPSQRVNRLTVTLTDIFEILSAVEMVPGGPYPADPTLAVEGIWGDQPPGTDSAGQIFYDNAQMGDRIKQVLKNAGIPDEFAVIFTGNVWLYEGWFTAGESAMDVIQQAADAEFPGVSNVYTNRLGQLVAHGRLAKFDPAGVLAGPGVPDVWDWHHWHAGDGAAVALDPSTTAHIRQFGFNRGLSKVINSALATPITIDDDDMPAQTVTDPGSIGLYGIRSWSAQSLLTKGPVGAPVDYTTALEETKRFATYYVDNYKTVKNRVTACGLRTIDPAATGAAETWRLLSLVDISDQVDITVGSPGGGGFVSEPYYVEGVHESVQPLRPGYDDVTLTLDLSPKAFFDTNPFS